MKNPMPLYDCTCKLDAYFLKNSIQRVSCISVEIIRKNDNMTLMVDKANYDKSLIILMNQLALLPSFVSQRAVEEQKEVVIETSRSLEPKRYLIEESFFKLLNFNFNTLFMNYSFSGAYRL